MTWHREPLLDADHSQAMLGGIHNRGGTVTSSRPRPDGCSIVYVTLDE